MFVKKGFKCKGAKNTNICIFWFLFNNFSSCFNTFFNDVQFFLYKLYIKKMKQLFLQKNSNVLIWPAQSFNFNLNDAL